MLNTQEHATRKILVEGTQSLIATHGVDRVTVEMVLAETKVSKGSLYHHFKDFDHLINTVQMRNYSAFVDEAISMLGQAFGSARSAEELRNNLFAVIPMAHDPARASGRIDRARVIGSSVSNVEFARVLAQEQERLRGRGEELMARAQAQGWVNMSLSPRALVSFIMSFTFGRVLDDVCDERVHAEDWNDVVRQFMDGVLLV